VAKNCSAEWGGGRRSTLRGRLRAEGLIGGASERRGGGNSGFLGTSKRGKGRVKTSNSVPHAPPCNHDPGPAPLVAATFRRFPGRISKEQYRGPKIFAHGRNAKGEQKRQGGPESLRYVPYSHEQKGKNVKGDMGLFSAS